MYFPHKSLKFSSENLPPTEGTSLKRFFSNVYTVVTINEKKLTEDKIPESDLSTKTVSLLEDSNLSDSKLMFMMQSGYSTIKEVISYFNYKSAQNKVSPSITGYYLAFLAANECEENLSTLLNSIKYPSISHYLPLINHYTISLNRRKVTYYFGCLLTAKIKPSIYIYNRMMNCYLEHSQSSMVIKLFNDSQFNDVRPNSETFNVIIAACFKEKRFGKLEYFCRYMINNKFQPAAYAYDASIKYCAEVRDYHQIDFYLKDMMAKNISRDLSFSTLINYFSVNNDIESVKDFLFGIMEHHIKPNKFHFNCLIQAFSTVNATESEFYFKEISRNGLQPDAASYNSLINALLISNQVLKAENYLKEMLSRNLFPNKANNAFILEYYYRNKFFYKLETYIKILISNNLILDMSWSVLLKVYLEKIDLYIDENFVAVNSITHTRNLQLQKLLVDAPDFKIVPNVAILNIWIKSHTDVNSAVKAFDMMESCNVQPDRITYLNLMGVFLLSSESNAKLFYQTSTEKGLNFTTDHYNTAFELILESDASITKVDRLFQYMRSRDVKFDEETIYLLSNIFMKHQDITLVKYCFDSITPNNLNKKILSCFLNFYVNFKIKDLVKFHLKDIILNTTNAPTGRKEDLLKSLSSKCEILAANVEEILLFGINYVQNRNIPNASFKDSLPKNVFQFIDNKDLLLDEVASNELEVNRIYFYLRSLIALGHIIRDEKILNKSLNNFVTDYSIAESELFEILNMTQISRVTFYELILRYFSWRFRPDRCSVYWRHLTAEKIKPNAIMYFYMQSSYKQSSRRVEQHFKAMLASGIKPISKNYEVLIKAEIKNKNLEKAEYYFDKMALMKLVPSIVSINFLITAHSVEGHIEKVQYYYQQAKKFNLLSKLNYNALLIAYAKVSNEDEILYFFNEMQSMSILPEHSTFNTILKVHSRNMPKFTQYLQNFYVTGFTPCNVTYHIVIGAFLGFNNLKKVGYYLKEVKTKGFKLNQKLLSSIVAAFTKVGDLQQVDEIVKYMVAGGIKLDHHIYCSLIKMYSILKNLKKVEDIILQMQKDSITFDVPVYNAIIEAYVLNNQRNCGERYYQKMIANDLKPDIKTFDILIKAFSKVKNEKKVLFYFEELEKEGIKPDAHLYGALISSSENNIWRVEFLLQEMQTQGIALNEFIYTALIRIYSKVNNRDKVEFFIRKINVDKIERSSFTNDAIFNYYSKQKDLLMVNETLDLIFNSKLNVDVTTFNNIIRGFANEKDVGKVEYYFHYMQKCGVAPDLFTYNILLSCYSKLADAKKVDVYFEKLVSSGIKPDIVTYNTLIASAIKDDVVKAFRYAEELLKEGLTPNIITYNILYFSSVGKFQNLDEAKELLISNMKEFFGLSISPDISTWTSIMTCFSYCNDNPTAVYIFRKLTGTFGGLDPPDLPVKIKELNLPNETASNIMFSVALDACKHGNLYEDLEFIWDFALDYTVNLDSNVLTSYIEALCHFKKFEKVIYILKASLEKYNTGKKQYYPLPNSKTYTSTLHGLKVNGGLKFIPTLRKIIFSNTDIK
ncbi:hypothetical protein HK099_006038 [Clydaea vesicula]|uniref:Pentatricopeptide repeat-containing protein n=1 Tax=Clydaea vesicula TaxID=447962 RepID=A0AAD5U827_9FUNG|nr:hypothetical protein HK099_006038 [Clydaea vesicula]